MGLLRSGRPDAALHALALEVYATTLAGHDPENPDALPAFGAHVLGLVAEREQLKLPDLKRLIALFELVLAAQNMTWAKIAGMAAEAG